MVTLTGGDKLQARLSEMAKKLSSAAAVEVGFMADSTYPSGESVAKIAALNEFGSEKAPPRPFFRGMINDKSGEWPDAVADLLKANEYDGRRTLEQTGAAIKGQLQDAITVYVGPPLSPVTIAKKGHDKQLVDSGVMLRSVDYRVE